MTSDQIRGKFLEFFQKHGHIVRPSSSLVPENDPSVLFTTAGMQQFKLYYIGQADAQKDFQSKNVTTVQKCVRTSDIDEVGDERHLTFFEMLGNFSFGDYFKEGAIRLAYEFVTKEMGLEIDYVTVFAGENNVPADVESEKIWKSFDAGITVKKCGRADNFWGPTGEEGPCGPTTEVYVDGIEIWNIVFNEFYQEKGGNLKPLAIPGIDTGMGLERLTLVSQCPRQTGEKTIFETDLFQPVIAKIEELSAVSDIRARRIVADHVRAAVFMIADGVTPSNTDRGYILRRLLRRAVRYSDVLGIKAGALIDLAGIIVEQYKNFYPEVKIQEAKIKNEIQNEESRFRETLARGMREFEKVSGETISGQDAFTLFSTYGFPFELTQELAKDKGIAVAEEEFKLELKKHQDLSRAGAEQKFKGGLASGGEIETKYHTATHLLLAALRQVLGEEIVQKGSNITSERLRFDFNWPEKLTAEQLSAVGDLVNQKIGERIPVEMLELPKEEAKKIVTTLSFDLDKYGDIVKVYKIGDFSIEFCGGPHVKNTGELGHFKIVKEEAVAAGIRRIKAVL